MDAGKLRQVRKWGSVLAGLAVLVVILMWLSGAFHSKVEPGRVAVSHEAIRAEEVGAVREIEVPEIADAVGTVRARHQTAVSSKLLETILEVKVAAGQRVSKGEVVAVLDDRDLQAQLSRAHATVAAAKADLAMRKADYNRYKALLEGKNVSRQEYDVVEARYNVAVANLDAAEQAANETAVTLSYTQIRSPVAGLVIEKVLEAGDMARPGYPILTIYDPTQLRLEADVREALTASISVGQKLDVEVYSVNLKGEGTVEEIVPQANVASRSLIVKVALPENASKRVYIGMFGRLLVPTGKRKAIVVPAAAVESIGQIRLVTVVLPDGASQRRFVQTGERIGNDVEILSGLNAGERLRVAGKADAGEAE